MIMEDIKEQEYLCRLTLQPVRIMDQKPIIHSDNVVQQTRDSGSNQIPKPGPLTGLLIRVSDCFLRSYVLNRLGGGRVVRRCHVSCVTGASN